MVATGYVASVQAGAFLDLLLEAHIFNTVKVDQDIRELVLSRARQKDKAPWTNDEWKKIVSNATAWCKRNHVRLTYAGT